MITVESINDVALILGNASLFSSIYNTETKDKCQIQAPVRFAKAYVVKWSSFTIEDTLSYYDYRVQPKVRNIVMNPTHID